LEDPLNITNIDQNNIVEDYTAFTVLIAATNRISLYWSGGAYSVIFIYIRKKAANSSATSLSLKEKS
jgi:hypothetical protein